MKLSWAVMFCWFYSDIFERLNSKRRKIIRDVNLHFKTFFAFCSYLKSVEQLIHLSSMGWHLVSFLSLETCNQDTVTLKTAHYLWLIYNNFVCFTVTSSLAAVNACKAAWYLKISVKQKLQDFSSESICCST